MQCESKDFRKGIHMLEWERRRLEMEIEDLSQKVIFEILLFDTK